MLSFQLLSYNPAIIVSSSVADPSYLHFNSMASLQNTTTASQKTYVWFFGYVGDTFYPEYQLGINQTTMIDLAKNLSETLGKNTLILATAVDEIPVSNTTEYPSGTISPSMIPNVTSYVSQLENYSSAVYGRLQFNQFNLSSYPGYGSCTLGGGSGPWYDCPIYNQTALYIDTLHLNGVWFDIDVQYYNKVGPLIFNQMMQNLTNLFPNATFILNESPASLSNGTENKYIVEVPSDCSGGCNWENDTYVEPSTFQNLTVSENEIQTLNSYFPGHVLLHFDASGPSPLGRAGQPMSAFGHLSNPNEISILQSLLYEGANPVFSNESFDLVVPLIGSWDFLNNSYPGVLYNSLTIGNYARSTISAFEQVIVQARSLLSFSDNNMSSNKGTCTLPLVGKGNLLALGVAAQSAKSNNPISIVSVTDNLHDTWNLQSNASAQQNESVGQLVLVSVYSTIASKEISPLKITVSFSGANSHAKGSLGCYDLIGNFSLIRSQQTFGTATGGALDAISATTFSPLSNSFEIGVTSIESNGCSSCSISAGTGYSLTFSSSNNGEPTVGMEFKYPSSVQDDCDFALSGLGSINTGAVVCVAFNSPP